jgi:hypothetical protein
MSRKRSQQHLDLQQTDGDETEEDLLLNDDKKIKTKRAQNNDSTNTSPVDNKPECNNLVVSEGSNIKSNGNIQNLTKNRKSKKNSKLNKSSNNGGDDVISKKETTLSICHNHNKEDDEALQNKTNGGGNGCHKQLSANPFQELRNIGVMDRHKTIEEENQPQEQHKRNVIIPAHYASQVLEENGIAVKNKQGDCSNNSDIATFCNVQHQQPDIVSWFPLLSKTTAMQCRNEKNDTNAFRSNVEHPFASSSLKNSVKRNTFNCEDIASPKLAARHSRMLEQAAAKQAVISQRKRTPSLCFNISASETSDNECQNEIPLL